MRTTATRRGLLVLAASAAAGPAGAQAPVPGTGKVPTPFPAAQPRDASRFGAEALAQMARQEAEVERQLAGQAGLRRMYGQVPARQATAFQTALVQAFAGPGWTRLAARGPRGRDTWTEADGWTGGKQAIAWVNLLPSHGEGGLVPYTIITNMPD